MFINSPQILFKSDVKRTTSKQSMFPSSVMRHDSFEPSFISFKSQPKTAQEMINKVWQRGFIGFNESIPDEFNLFPPDMVTIKEDGNAVADKSKDSKDIGEIIVVNRSEDRILRETIQAFKAELNNHPTFNAEEALDFTLSYVKELLTPPGKTNEEIYKSIDSLAAEKPSWTIGDVIQKGEGVCRHRALLFKILADDVLKEKYGIKTALQFGATLISPKTSSLHVWNVALLKDAHNQSKALLVDPMSNEKFDLKSFLNLAHPDFDNRNQYITQPKSGSFLDFIHNGRPFFLYGNKLNTSDNDFSAMELQNKILFHESFDQYNFSRANLTHSQIALTDFFASTFDKANFHNSTLQDVFIEDSSLNKTDFDGTDFNNTTFKHSQLKEANFSNAFFDGITFNHCDLRGANFVKVLFDKVDFNECNLKNAYVDRLFISSNPECMNHYNANQIDTPLEKLIASLKHPCLKEHFQQDKRKIYILHPKKEVHKTP